MNFLSVWRISGKFRVGFVLLIILLVIALAEPFIIQLLIGDKDPIIVGAYKRYLDPSPEHWLGTDRLGRDVLALVIQGIRNSLFIGVLAGTMATAVGIVVGFIAGYKGGIIDTLLRSFTDMLLVIPTFPLLIALASYVRNISIPVMALLLAAFSWPFAARTIRAQVLSLRERSYVELAQMSGENDMEIIFKELMPNLLPYLFVGLAFATIGAIFAETGLELIGLGPGNIATLGLMINWAIGWGVMSLGKWAMILAPTLCLAFLFTAMNAMNMGMEETFNPRLRNVTGR
jgi:peptide/nickel transport system permease protein